jgi:nitroreductase
MDVYEAIATRKSVRSYRDEDVPEELLERILAAARIAPSASNRQEWRFVVVRDPATRQQLVQAANGQRFVGQAPVVLACCAETDEGLMPCGHLRYTIDLAIAIDHITLCAAAEGLGTCWIGAFSEQRVREILGIPRQVRVVALLPLGYPADPSPKAKSRLPLEQIVMRERWQGG